MAVVSGCETPITAPERAATVPEDAVWAGGTDGGDWIDCEHKFAEPYVGYQCDIYNDWTGDLHSSGVFVLAYMSGESIEPAPANPLLGGAIREYDFYNGSWIRISEKKVLLPDGWIDHPFGDGHGKRVHCVLGECEEGIEY